MRERAVELYAEGVRDKAWMAARLTHCDDALAKLRAAVAAARKQGAEPIKRVPILVDAAHMPLNLPAIWPSMTLPERRAILSKLVEPLGFALELLGHERQYNKWHPKSEPPTRAVNGAFDSRRIADVRLRAAFRDPWA